VIDDELIAVGGLVDACEGANAAARACSRIFAQHHILDHAAEDAALISQVSTSQTPAAPGRQMKTLIMPLSLKVSVRRTCR